MLALEKPMLEIDNFESRDMRWLDRDTNPCLNFQRIGESKQRPLELCSWTDLEALPPIGKEYHQRYKLVNDRLPKARQRLHRAAEFRRGIDGRARNNAPVSASPLTMAHCLTLGKPRPPAPSSPLGPSHAARDCNAEEGVQIPLAAFLEGLAKVESAHWGEQAGPLELCRWDDLEALPPIGKEYHQRYKLVNDRLPKARQRLHRAAEYRWSIDGRARNNA
ncbi:hypothetical protein QJQ45_026818 [Haematococcus lacustris]|nr:hypothetical protein QJQ45_026818 [Haematococcus lacustris]